MMSARDFIDEFRKERNFAPVFPMLISDANFQEELFQVIACDEYKYADYAAWIAIHFFEKHPSYFQRWIDRFEIWMNESKNHSVQRNLCHVFLTSPVPLHDRGVLLDCLFRFVTSSDSLPALKVSAFKTIEFHYLKHYPEFLGELNEITSLWKNDNRPSIISLVTNFKKRNKKALMLLS